MNLDLNDIKYRLSLDDHSALKALYDQFANSFFQLALAIVHSSETAEEIVEDVFIEVWKKRVRVAQIENLHLYLYVAVRNMSKSYLRKHKNKKFINFDDVQLPYFRIDCTPEDIMISQEMVNRINASINELPAKCRLIFKLVKEDGLRYKEVAELLHLSVKTVENQLAIALRKIHASVRVHLPVQNF